MTLEENLELMIRLLREDERLCITFEDGKWRVQSGETWAWSYELSNGVNTFINAKLNELKGFSPKPMEPKP